ncbi:hypothetical protein GHT06_014988 [Daphnia sinensis]|uniref:Uncharacterized protein n=1 Tax=Daphnia sinensis TaxID=1820382 RepID=A0AAD5L8R6_9CRUS|nr:hypothetical protein GHT06_014988 [Daphnia sinensis]
MASSLAMNNAHESGGARTFLQYLHGVVNEVVLLRRYFDLNVDIEEREIYVMLLMQSLSDVIPFRLCCQLMHLNPFASHSPRGLLSRCAVLY